MRNKRNFYSRAPDRRKLKEIFLEAATCTELSHETSRKYWSWIKRLVDQAGPVLEASPAIQVLPRRGYSVLESFRLEEQA